ncbi:MAG TPA: tributyrin esterase [Methanotrichaceae archaeon]|nr:tributyrin esterase [Methanotrichaceae archaeon]
MKVKVSGQSCLCDFTFDFYWQHKGTRLNPDDHIGGVTYRQMVDALKRGEEVVLEGDAGNRLASGMGIDLKRLGGSGNVIEETGRITVDGDAGTRMGISMQRGAIYISGHVACPMGNIVEVETDRTGYRKYLSITDVLVHGGAVLGPNRLSDKGLALSDGIIRETIAARCPVDRSVFVSGDAGMSTGILMQSGTITVDGDSGMNTGVLMKGGRIIVKGSCGDFTATEMLGGEIFVESSAGSYCGAKMVGGTVYARNGKAVPPVKAGKASASEQGLIARLLDVNPIHAMMYQKFSIV